jgi:hypothetical protein
MFAGDRQLDVAVVEESTAEHTRLDAEVLAPEGVLDRDLPEARRREQELVVLVLEKPARGERRFG